MLPSARSGEFIRQRAPLGQTWRAASAQEQREQDWESFPDLVLSCKTPLRVRMLYYGSTCEIYHVWQ
jgi:hypothetical protein